MNKPLSWMAVVLAVSLAGCGQNTIPTTEPILTAQGPSQNEQAPADRATNSPNETDPGGGEQRPTEEPQGAATEPPVDSQEEVPSVLPTDAAQDPVPQDPVPPETDEPAQQEDPLTAPTEDAAQDPVPEELDEPAQQYEAETGESLASSAAIGSTMTPATMHDYLTAVLQDVDSYWTGVWGQAGYQEPMVSYNFPMPGQSVAGACGATDDNAMQYCPLDDMIVFSQDVATRLWNGQVKVNADPETGAASGDFSVAFLLAHEYSHNLQDELGLLPRTQVEMQNRRFPVYKTELHADCWAGVWANSAYYKGYLQGGDVEEAVQTGRLVGDYQFSDPQHHGTPQQRVDAFMMGYNAGVPSSCDTWLLSNY